MRIVHPVALRDLTDLKKLTSKIQDAKRKGIAENSLKWSDGLETEFAELEGFASGNPYVALDLEYLRDGSHTNRSFGYVVTTTRL